MTRAKRQRAAEHEDGVSAGGRGPDESGQAMTEYIILVLFVALVCVPIVKLLPAAVREYARPFYYCVSRPIP